MRCIEFDIRIQSEAAALEEGVSLLQGTAAVHSGVAAADPFGGYLDLLAGGQRLHQRSAVAHRNKVLILQHLAEVFILGVLHRSAHHLRSLCSGLPCYSLLGQGGGLLGCGFLGRGRGLLGRGFLGRGRSLLSRRVLGRGRSLLSRRVLGRGGGLLGGRFLSRGRALLLLRDRCSRLCFLGKGLCGDHTGQHTDAHCRRNQLLASALCFSHGFSSSL